MINSTLVFKTKYKFDLIQLRYFSEISYASFYIVKINKAYGPLLKEKQAFC